MMISHLRINASWMAEEEDLLGTMILSGENAACIAKRLNRTTRAVRRRAEVLKLFWKAGRAPDLNAPRTKLPAFARWKADEELVVKKIVQVRPQRRIYLASARQDQYRRSEPSIQTWV